MDQRRGASPHWAHTPPTGPCIAYGILTVSVRTGHQSTYSGL